MKNLSDLFDLPEQERLKILKKVVKKANKDQRKIYESKTQEQTSQRIMKI